MIKIAAFRSGGPIGSLINWYTSGVYSHVALFTPDETIVEAWAGDGVVERPFCLGHKGASIDLYRFDHTPKQSKVILEFARKQVGKKYDYPGIANFVFRFKSPEKVQDERKEANKWFCSELVAASLAKAGLPLFIRKQPWQIDPDWCVSSPILDYESSLNLV